jgi:hypothetical protein
LRRCRQNFTFLLLFEISLAHTFAWPNTFFFLQSDRDLTQPGSRGSGFSEPISIQAGPHGGIEPPKLEKLQGTTPD